MEDKKLFYTFIGITGILNITLLVISVIGLNKYIQNIQIINQNNQNINNLNNNIENYKQKLNFEKANLDILKKRLNPNTSIASYIEQLELKSKERKVVITKSTVTESTNENILINLKLYGTFNSVLDVAKEIETDLPLTEIVTSRVETKGELIEMTMDLKVYLNKND
jgi:hypothetical protein